MSTTEEAFRLDDVVFSSYEGRTVLNRLTLSAARGSATALVGHVGGGKTTVLRLLAALVRATYGSVRALGVDRVTHVLQTHTHGDHCGGAYLWRAAGAQIVAPKSAAIAQTWLMPMLTDYGIFPPRPVDVPLKLTRVGDEVEFEAGGLRFGAVFVPGHTFDLTLYKIELAGQRVVFTVNVDT